MLKLQKTIDNNSPKRFILIENILDFKDFSKLKKMELCIITTDFNEFDLKLIKQIKLEYKNLEFWLASHNINRKNMLWANDIGIKNIIPAPVGTKLIEEFFKKSKNQNSSAKQNQDERDYSAVSGLSVMIVDDNSMNIQLLEEVLSDFDLKISSYLKPKDAMESALRNKFDLFLLDIMMPEISGFDLAKQIKEVSHNRNVPIMFISALSDSHNKIASYDLGSYAYIEKPFDIGVIKSQIYNVLKNKQEQDLITSTKDDFMATIAHDLKTPIRAEINALNLLLNKHLGELEEGQKEILEDILTSTKFMKDMVENILCKNKIDNDQVSLTKQFFSINELVIECIDLTKYILAAKKQYISFYSSIENPLLPIDYLEMKRAIHNLIANASQYSPKDTEIIIESFQQKDMMGISIQDFGKGIDKEQQKDIFEQYMTHAKKYKLVGSGLGLYITKNIVESHGGEIKLESEVGYGTKITILLPRTLKG